MAIRTDLSWQEVLVKLPANSITIVNGKVYIDVSILTGDTRTSLSDFGVIEFLHKFITASKSAQDSNNNAYAIGERLASFPAISTSPPANGYTQVTLVVITKVPFDPDEAIGVNN